MTDVRIQSSRSPLGLLQRVGDAVVIGGTLYASQALAGQYTSNSTLLVAVVAVLVYLFVCEASNVVRTRVSATASSDLVQVLMCWTLTLLVIAMLAFFSRLGLNFARSSVFGWIILGGSGLGLTRMLFRIAAEFLVKNGIAGRKCAIAGVNSLGLQLRDNAEANLSCGLQITGFFDDRQADRWNVDLPEEQYHGKLEQLVIRAKRGEIDTVFVTLPMRAEARIKWLLDQLADTTASAYIVPDFFVFELLHSRWDLVGDLPAVSVFESPLYGVDSWIKRVFDVGVASAGLLLISPVMLLVAAMVKLTSAGPIFFRQKRYGLDGKEIWVWKFRSMTTCDNGPSVAQATKNDARITPLGAVLRKTSLDELPQLFNVLEGTMSLVGPRPHASAHNEHYRKLIHGYMLRHKVKPGITGLAQVEGFRGETETLDKMQKRVDYDHRYIQQWSLFLDIKILLRTFLVVFKQENAY
ncbi:MAG TPA: undecaprenyl-phosphate glucose phosphotransferase [Planctomycetaceae bacterium]|nr:undecaprenyl-phosphate glucose phosphotransferase [Planctomycetaceae bacterium]